MGKRVNEAAHERAEERKRKLTQGDLSIFDCHNCGAGSVITLDARTGKTKIACDFCGRCVEGKDYNAALKAWGQKKQKEKSK